MRLKTTTYQQGNGNLDGASYQEDRKDKYAIRNLLLRQKSNGFSRNVMIPDDLIAEMESFAQRNMIIPVSNLPRSDQSPLNSTCKQCLKAHTIKKAREMGVDKKSMDFLMGVFDCELGHNGYYMDGRKLISLN